MTDAVATSVRPGSLSGRFCFSLLFLSLEAIFVVPVTVYPFCFVLFGCSVIVWLLGTNRPQPFPRRRGISWLGCWLYPAYAVGLFYWLGGDDRFALRLFVNVAFFLAASTLFLSVRGSRHEQSMKHLVTWALFIAVLFSAVQTFANVTIGHLWLWPASIQNSDDAYAIRDVSTVIFGDYNKNIWATKTLLTYLEFFALRNDGTRWRRMDKVAFVSFLFVLVYTSSRTAQLACVFGFAGYALRAKWPKVSFSGKVRLAAVVAAATWFAVTYSRLPQLSNVDIATQGIAGDGFLGRIVLWIYFSFAVPGFSWWQTLFGHGVSAVTEFVSASFSANNLQNVFLNQFFDLGLIGLALYCSFLVFSFQSLNRRWRWLFAPTLLVLMSSQYFGFDPELMVFFAVSVLLSGDSMNRVFCPRAGQGIPSRIRSRPSCDPSLA